MNRATAGQQTATEGKARELIGEDDVTLNKVKEMAILLVVGLESGAGD